MIRGPRSPEPGHLACWRAYHLCAPDHWARRRHPHVARVGVTYDPEAGVARVVAGRGRRKVAHVRTAGPAGAPVAVCQVEGGKWATLEERATVSEDGKWATLEGRAPPSPRTPNGSPTRSTTTPGVTAAPRHPTRNGWSSRSP